MLTSKQRAYLRSISNTMEPIIQVGKGGVNDNLIKQIDDALEARELIKVTVLTNSPDEVREVCNEFEEKIKFETVCTIGSKAVLYRKAKKNSKIELPR